MLKRVLLFIMLLLSVAIGGVAAQEDTLGDEDLELIEYVGEAFTNMAELETVATEAEQTIDQTIEAAGQTITQVIDQTVTGVTIFGDDLALESTVVQEITTVAGFQNVTLDMTMDMVAVDDALWVQVRDVSAIVANQFPNGWVDLSEDPMAIPGMELFDLDQMMQQTNSGLNYPITPEAVSSIAEIDEAEIDDQTMRVFEILIDWQGFINSEQFETMRSMFNPGGVDGVDVDAMMNQMFNGANIELVVYIGADDQLVHQVDIVMNIAAEIEGMIPGVATVDMVQDLTGSYRYFDFNEDAEITAPSDL